MYTKTQPYKSYPTGKQILSISGLYLYVYNSGLEKKHTYMFTRNILYTHMHPQKNKAKWGKHPKQTKLCIRLYCNKFS